QILQSVSSRYLPFTLTTSVMYFVLNIPLFILGWFKIGHKFTFFTLIAVLLGSIMMKIIAPIKMSYDPIICAIFGGVINGVGTGIALKSGISTGGLDVLGIILRKKTGKSFGQINIFFNLIIVVCAGFVFGWSRALYTALNIFVNGKVIDAVYTQHQKMQVIIVTEHPKHIIEGVQKTMHRGITILHDAEGAYSHTEKTVLLTVIDRYDMYDIYNIVLNSDPYAFMSVTEVAKVYGRFKERKPV
uniref:YitT family protein n=1 Tax=uncultured Lactobacillus sp. TaxID=153152 RepID=UPI0026280A54